MTYTYKTIQGDFFDYISYKVFGTEKYANVLIRENPLYADVVRFDAGIVLMLPIIANPNTNISAVPWGTLQVK
jgi:phage tail protein X